MKAVVDGRVAAESDDIIACRSHEYFPRATVRME